MDNPNLFPGPVHTPASDQSAWPSSNWPYVRKEGRLEALRRYQILDTGSEESFDRLTRLAASLFDAPISLVTFIGEDRQWFKSAYGLESVGLEQKETGLEVSFCAHAIRSEVPTVVHDALEDEHFSENPFVTGNPGIRFYAGVPLSTPDGHRVGTLCVLDTEPRHFSSEKVSQLKDLAEMATDELELRLQKFIFNRTFRFTGLMTPDGILIEANKAGLEFGGLTKEEVLGKRLWKTPWFQGGETTRQKLQQGIRKAASGEPARFEVEVQGRERKRTIDFLIRPIPGKDSGKESENGEVSLLLPEGRDVTKQKEKRLRLKEEKEEAKEKLREQEALLGSVTENISEGIYRSTPDEGLIYVNQAFADLFGYESVSEVLEADPETLYASAEERDRLREESDRLGGLDGVEVEFQRKDGSTFTGLLRDAVVCGEDGTARFYDGAIADITERKQWEEKLKQAKWEAEEANRQKSAYLANISHEIRTPLTSIIGFAEAIGEEVKASEKVEATEVDPREELETGNEAKEQPSDEARGPLQRRPQGAILRFARLIEKSGNRLLEVLNGVLNLSKLDAGKMELVPEPVDLAEESEETASLFRPQAQEAAVTLQAEGPEAPVWAHANPEGLRMVLRNLISNAIKYTDSGGTVQIRVREEDGSAVLEVEDTGIGMDPEEVPELFRPFEQDPEGEAQTKKGTGLGLAVTRKAVRQMGGSIEVETEKGEGSCFTVYLPIDHARGSR